MFRPDQYQPQTNEGRHLLAHELTHVIQQGDRSAPNDQVAVGGPTILENATLQREADNWADRITRSSLPQSTTALVPSAVPGSAPLSVQLQEDSESAKKAPEAEVLPEKTPLELATELVAESPTTAKDRATWMLKAADRGFVTFDTKKAVKMSRTFAMKSRSKV